MFTEMHPYVCGNIYGSNPNYIRMYFQHKKQKGTKLRDFILTLWLCAFYIQVTLKYTKLKSQIISVICNLSNETESA